MKIDKRNPKHWLILISSALMLLIVLIPARIYIRIKKQKSVALYGHKLNGNLLPFYEYGLGKKPLFDFYYLSLDSNYINSLDEKRNVLNGINIAHLFILASSSALITDHGPHHFVLLKKLTNMKFIDVWHGIPYKGFNSESFGIKYYDQIWVSSPAMRDMWVDMYGFEFKKVKPVGYARVERLLNLRGHEAEIRKKYGLENKKTVLVAPTWQQDDAGRSIIPFGLSLGEFAKSIASDKNVQVIFRAHLNVKDRHAIEDVAPNVKIMSYADYPVGEDFLAVSDVLISDWSSIVFDYLPLNRPVIYLDVKPPFRLGFSLGPEYRFGAVVGNKKELRLAVENALNNHSKFQSEHRKTINKSMKVSYGDTLDGKVVKRSIELLKELID